MFAYQLLNTPINSNDKLVLDDGVEKIDKK